MRVYLITNWSKPTFRSHLLSLFSVLLFLTVIAFGLSILRPWAYFKPAWEPPLFLLELALEKGLPNLSLEVSRRADNSPGDLWGTIENLIYPLTFIANSAIPAQPVTASEEEYWPLSKEESPPPLPPPKKIPPADKKHPLVAIYNTHNSEAYRPSEGRDKFPGQNGGVSRVAATLARTLREDYGLPVVLSTTIHDYPDFTRSYMNSEQTLRQILTQNPSVQVALDIHRDAGLEEAPVVEINGQKVAQILLIVGTDARLKHPNWRQNEAFARKVEAKMNQLYPGLCRGIRLQEGRYNQHLHPHALLVEVGSNDNTLEAAELAGKLFAQVIAEVIKELNQQNII